MRDAIEINARLHAKRVRMSGSKRDDESQCEYWTPSNSCAGASNLVDMEVMRLSPGLASQSMRGAGYHFELSGPDLGADKGLRRGHQPPACSKLLRPHAHL